MSKSAAVMTSERDSPIVALNYLTRSELEAQFLSLTHKPPPRMTRSLLVTAVATETVRRRLQKGATSPTWLTDDDHEPR